jgi:hypothetical protein
MYPDSFSECFRLAFGTHCLIALKQAVSEVEWNPEVFPFLHKEVEP